MIEPSSSEEDEEEVPDAPSGGQNKHDVPNGKISGPKNGPNGPNANDGGQNGMKDLKSNDKVTSPTQSHNSEKNLTEAELQVNVSFFRQFIRCNKEPVRSLL